MLRAQGGGLPFALLGFKTRETDTIFEPRFVRETLNIPYHLLLCTQEVQINLQEQQGYQAQGYQVEVVCPNIPNLSPGTCMPHQPACCPATSFKLKRLCNTLQRHCQLQLPSPAGIHSTRKSVNFKFYGRLHIATNINTSHPSSGLQYLYLGSPCIHPQCGTSGPVVQEVAPYHRSGTWKTLDKATSPLPTYTVGVVLQHTTG